MTDEAPKDSRPLSRADAEILRAMMEEFFLDGTLNPDETRVFLTICTDFNFGRPVPPHGSGP